MHTGNATRGKGLCLNSVLEPEALVGLSVSCHGSPSRPQHRVAPPPPPQPAWSRSREGEEDEKKRQGQLPKSGAPAPRGSFRHQPLRGLRGWRLSCHLLQGDTEGRPGPGAGGAARRRAEGLAAAEGRGARSRAGGGTSGSPALIHPMPLRPRRAGSHASVGAGSLGCQPSPQTAQPTPGAKRQRVAAGVREPAFRETLRAPTAGGLGPPREVP